MPDLDDYMLFIAVADSGGLAGATRATGVSTPTLSRRMGELERKLGQRLFARGPRGYALTSQGRILRQEADGLTAVASRLKTLASAPQKARVRITAGHWTSCFLVKHLATVWSQNADWIPEFVATNSRVDIARREADIGIRNRRPDQNWLASQKVNRIEYGVFALSGDIQGFVALTEEQSTTPSERWLRKHHAHEIRTTATHVSLVLNLARAGMGRIVLPVFAARQVPELVQLDGTIPDLSHDAWLVSHHEARHDPPIRAALDAVSSLLRDKSLY